MMITPVTYRVRRLLEHENKKVMLKKLMLLAALLAMVFVAAVPAIAQVTQGNSQQVRSGDSTQTITVTGGGDNSNACQGIQGINNTGNSVTNTGVLQYASPGKVGVGGVGGAGNWEMKPSQSNSVDQKGKHAA